MSPIGRQPDKHASFDSAFNFSLLFGMGFPPSLFPVHSHHPRIHLARTSAAVAVGGTTLSSVSSASVAALISSYRSPGNR